MHVLPLPFGLALALLPRREADRLSIPRPPRRATAARRDRLAEIPSADVRLFLR